MSERRRGKSKLVVRDGKIVVEQSSIAMASGMAASMPAFVLEQAPQLPHQVIGEATVRMRKDGLRILDAALNDIQAKGWLYGIVDANQFQPGDIVSIEVVLKERKR